MSACCGQQGGAGHGATGSEHGAACSGAWLQGCLSPCTSRLLHGLHLVSPRVTRTSYQPDPMLCDAVLPLRAQVGSATLLLGLQSLVNARTSMGARGRDIYFVPTVTSQPLRQSSTPAPAAASSTPATDGEQPAAEVKAPAADAAAATSDPQMVEVVRLFVGVSRPAQPRRDAAARASAPAPAASEAAQPSPSVGSEQVPEAPAAQAQPQQVTVPLSELESLRSALSTMMQQQQQLEALLRDRQQRQQPQASQQ